MRTVLLIDDRSYKNKRINMIEDKLLIFRCKQGCLAAFRRIYEKYEVDLRTLAANLLDDRTAAEDVVHDVFISLLGVVDRFELRSSLAGYLKTCVANKARDYLRKKRPQSIEINAAGPAPPDDNGPVQWVIQTELTRQLDTAMSRLPYEQKEAVVLYVHGRMKFKTIAKLQNVSIKTAHTRYRDGLEKLRSMLNSELEK